MNAIETTYGGCRFRSRLEARWAVFFDALGVAWQYEPQGYLVGDIEEPYLPDFYLPDLTLWVEVKGAADERDLRVLTAAAAPTWSRGLPENGDSMCLNLLVLSEVPRIDLAGDPVHMGLGLDGRPALHGVLAMWAWLPTGKAGLAQFSYPRWPILPLELTDPMRIQSGLRPGRRIAEAYSAARSARFEHGERG